MRLAVDIGGTFTDAALECRGERFTAKVLTTHSFPGEGFLNAIAVVLNEAGASPEDVKLIVHGTTLATNAIIERRGAKTALIATAGHRDSLEMAYENRFEQYDVNIDRPLPLAPRSLRFTVSERLNRNGEVLVSLDEEAVRTLAQELESAGVESVAIGFLHAYANSIHEKRAAEIISEVAPSLSITLSSEVCPEIREFDRLSTACANAYVRPLMAQYLNRLKSELDAQGFESPFLLITSGGGLTTLETAAKFPIRLVESGPAGGVVLAQRIAEEYGLNRLLSFDMGGTTAKLCMIDDCKPLVSRTFEVDRAYRFKKGSGLPVRIPVIEMVEIGAGGGSIVSVDKLKRVAVGPESAGSEPGPACYGRGGDRPTISDSDVLLGRIVPEKFAEGKITLDVGAAQSAMKRYVGEPLGSDELISSFAVGEMVDENMAAAARAHAVEWGMDVAERTMVAFGGAAPLHAARVADKLGLTEVIVPTNAGVGSAVGFLMAPVAYAVVRSRHMLLSNLDAGTIDGLFRGMREEALAVVEKGAPGAEFVETKHAFMRFVGQGHEIAVALPDKAEDLADANIIKNAFDKEYKALFGRVIPNIDVEILSWTLSLRAGLESKVVRVRDDAQNKDFPDPILRRDCFDAGAALMVETPIYDRSALTPGMRAKGPLLITEAQTTTVVPSNFSLRVSSSGYLVLKRDDRSC